VGIFGNRRPDPPPDKMVDRKVGGFSRTAGVPPRLYRIDYYKSPSQGVYWVVRDGESYLMNGTFGHDVSMAQHFPSSVTALASLFAAAPVTITDENHNR
jgi:hypothetical protein